MVRRIGYIVLGAQVLFSIYGCTQDPAIISSHNVTEKNLVDLDAPYFVTIKPGDSLSTIADEYGANKNDLIQINSLKEPYILTPGGKLKLPYARYHIVGKGDTLYSIAKSYGINANDLSTANHINSPDHILAGSKLILPHNGVSSSRDMGQLNNNSINNPTGSPFVLSSPKKESSIESDDIDPLGVDNKALENNNDIFKQNSPGNNKDLNKDNAPKQILPNNINDPESTDGQAAKVQDISYTVPVPRSKPLNLNYQTDSEQKTTSSLQNDIMVDNFIWPVEGKIVARFGPREGGLFNDGINIQAREGTEVRAAGDGQVVYVGNQLKAYGNLILIKHDNGYLTAYAHNKNNKVSKNDRVKKGDIIAYVGKTGDVGLPQLHFSIRKGKKALNPEKHLPVLASIN